MFHKWRPSKVGRLHISNLRTTKVVEFIEYQRHGVINHLLYVKIVKIEKQR